MWIDQTDRSLIDALSSFVSFDGHESTPRLNAVCEVTNLHSVIFRHTVEVSIIGNGHIVSCYLRGPGVRRNGLVEHYPACTS